MRHHNPKRHRILHQATQAVCSTGFSRQDTIPAKAGTTSIEFELMQNPSQRGGGPSLTCRVGIAVTVM